ncbi:MAG: hypothetical protein MI863_22895 [Desulfobacterales bacterium]|nr:hypothetical protein [Desulfobacterales bacterium]
MKISDAMKKIDESWVTKKKGFRVRMHRREGNDWVLDCSPGEKSSPLDSDVTSWRLAWKLAQSTPLRKGEAQEGDMVNIHVVDQDDVAVIYYATGENEVFNSLSI